MTKLAGKSTSEQVSHGHPDKVADQISDLILDEILRQDPKGRSAVEVLVKGDMVVLAGEVSFNGQIPSMRELVSGFLTQGDARYGENISVLNFIEEQSPEIAAGVDLGGAGDQGIMVGYATNENSAMLPMAYELASRALELLMTHTSLGPDAKAQVTYDYDLGRIDTFLISAQHTGKPLDEAKAEIELIMSNVALEFGLNLDFRKLSNPAGEFTNGGAWADAGLTGRKIQADTYGTLAGHGGGAFSGKDGTKVDRSGAYMARWVARQIVQKDLADRIEVRVAYAIGVVEPVSLEVNAFGTSRVSDEELLNVVSGYDWSQRAITERFGLDKPFAFQTASYGHFRGDQPWEK